jgi:hypothetical protein
MLAVLEDETERAETRMQAAQWLADRGFGKAPTTIGLGEGGPADIMLVQSTFEGAKERLTQKLAQCVPLDELGSES